MLNPFPHLLDYSWYAPTLLRIAAALIFAISAAHFYSIRSSMLGRPIPLWGTTKAWMFWVGVVVSLGVAIFLFIGYEVQWAALIGALAALKYCLVPNRYRELLPLSRVASFMLLIICLSLLITGAGAVAFDLPL